VSARPPALLVEDNDAFARELEAALHDRGLRIDRASGWDEGLELFRVNGYELVIADYNLPDTDHGLELLAQIKMLIPSSRLVLISGALTPGAERSLDDVSLLDAYYSKSDANLTVRLSEHVEQAARDAKNSTDWQAFATGYIADLDRDHPEVRKIDEILRADLERGG
jgi:CheY-like chemotaxis protein